MGKNSQIHLNVETEICNQLKEQARKDGLSLSQYCRQKIIKGTQLEEIKFMIEKIYEIIVEG